eukprot:2035811-Rhodomonas_salina.2
MDRLYFLAKDDLIRKASVESAFALQDASSGGSTSQARARRGSLTERSVSTLKGLIPQFTIKAADMLNVLMSDKCKRYIESRQCNDICSETGGDAQRLEDSWRGEWMCAECKLLADGVDTGRWKSFAALVKQTKIPQLLPATQTPKPQQSK